MQKGRYLKKDKRDRVEITQLKENIRVRKMERK
jgi:hypothetical protein